MPPARFTTGRRLFVRQKLILCKISGTAAAVATVWLLWAEHERDSVRRCLRVAHAVDVVRLGSYLIPPGSRIARSGSRLTSTGSRVARQGGRVTSSGSRLAPLGSEVTSLGSRVIPPGSRATSTAGVAKAHRGFSFVRCGFPGTVRRGRISFSIHDPSRKAALALRRRMDCASGHRRHATVDGIGAAWPGGRLAPL